MTDKKFRRMSKSELIDIIYKLQENEQKYLSEIIVLEEKLNSKELNVSNYGSLAEAAIGINNVFEQAQAAADLYLAEVAKYNSGNAQAADTILSNAKQQADLIINQAYEQREAILNEVNSQLLTRQQEFKQLANQFFQVQSGFERVLFGIDEKTE